MGSKVRTVDPGHLAPGIIREAADIIGAGGIVVFPTTGLYGLGADIYNPDALDRIFRIKQRPIGKPLSVLIGEGNDLNGLVRHIPPHAVSIVKRFWPGKVTIVYEAEASLPERLTAGTGRIGVRLPAHPVAAALLRSLSFPITATSANLSGQPGCSQVVDLPPRVIDGVDLVLDAGPLMGGMGSTVVDVTVDPPRIIREGTVSTADILAVS
jgi:L-threonylcarbamoyladenylate synthase